MTQEPVTPSMVTIADLELTEAENRATRDAFERGRAYGRREDMLALLGEHEGNGCCDPKTLEHVAQYFRSLPQSARDHDARIAREAVSEEASTRAVRRILARAVKRGLITAHQSDHLYAEEFTCEECIEEAAALLATESTQQEDRK